MLRKYAIPFAMLVMSSAANAAGGYAGIGIGQASVDVDAYDFGPTVSSSVDDTDTSFKLFGGYTVNENFSIEAGYINFGEVGVDYTDGIDSLSQKFEATALYFSAIGSLPLGQASVFGKLGLASWKVDYSEASTFSLPYSTSASGIDPVLGIGVRFDVSEQVSLRAEIERYKDVGDKNKTGQEDVGVISAGVMMKF